jgi:hypothetical protein
LLANLNRNRQEKKRRRERENAVHFNWNSLQVKILLASKSVEIIYTKGDQENFNALIFQHLNMNTNRISEASKV